MKRLAFSLLAVALFTTGLSAAPSSSKVLTVVFSRVGSSQSFQGVDAVSSASLPRGNTLVIADQVQKIVGGDRFQIVTEVPYPSRYNDTTELALKEQQAKARPKLKTHLKSLADYDVIFLGYPNWWGTLPMAVKTFLEEYDFAGKTIVPFCTHEGSGLGTSERDIAQLAPKAKLAPGLAVRGSSVDGAGRDVQSWLARLGYRP
jgi:flavodoxin